MRILDMCISVGCSLPGIYDDTAVFDEWVLQSSFVNLMTVSEDLLCALFMKRVVEVAFANPRMEFRGGAHKLAANQRAL